MGKQHLDHVVPLVRESPREERVIRGPEGINVSPLVERFPPNLFRTHVMRSSRHLPFHRDRHVVVERAGQTKIR